MNPYNQNRLLNCSDFTNFVTMFFGLGRKEQLSVFGDTVTIKKGTPLYRIRCDDGKSNFNCMEAWNPPPANVSKKGRFNNAGESMLYVATSPVLLEREASIQNGQYYYLGEYVVKDDFTVATFLRSNNHVNLILHKIAMALSNENALTPKEQQALHDIEKQGVCINLLSMLAPFFLHRQFNNLYDITNKLGQLLFSHNKNGIRYASAYFPIELSGTNEILTFDGNDNGNLALTDEGRNNIEFVKSTRYQYKTHDELLVFIEEVGRNEIECQNLKN